MSQSAHEYVAEAAVHTIPRRFVALALVVVAVLLVGALVLIRISKSPPGMASTEVFVPAPASLIATVGHVPNAVSNTVGVTSPSIPTTPLTPTGNPSLWQAPTHGVVALPVVFFYGAEFAPYAAAERWPVVVALSRFGTFTQLGLVQSSTSVAFPGIQSFTFWHVSYSSSWLNLLAVERYGSQDPTGGGYATLEKPDQREAASVAAYDTSATTFPLLDVANHYVLVGSSFAPSVLQGLTQAQIAGALAVPTNPVTEAVLAAANEITAAICSVTGQRPATVCGSRGVADADVKMGLTTSH